jgi:hypothetical protein
VATAFISLTIIAVVFLLRKQFGETEAERLLKLMEAANNTAQMLVEAAEVAVVEVENSIKKYGDASDEELKASAVEIAAQLLRTWGIAVDQSLLRSLLALVEAAYQRMKAENTPVHTMPVFQ